MGRPEFDVAMMAVEKDLGYRFVSRRDLLQEALTSGAYAAAHPEGFTRNHGRLAFLGDAVLYLIVTEDALRHALPAGEGDRVSQERLTEARKARVSNPHLAKLADALNLRLPMRAGQADDHGKGDDTRNATAIEAIIGALYEDTGRDLDRTADIVLPLLERAV